jgi:hypothetical protein
MCMKNRPAVGQLTMVGGRRDSPMLLSPEGDSQVAIARPLQCPSTTMKRVVDRTLE